MIGRTFQNLKAKRSIIAKVRQIQQVTNLDMRFDLCLKSNLCHINSKPNHLATYRGRCWSHSCIHQGKSGSWREWSSTGAESYTAKETKAYRATWARETGSIRLIITIQWKKGWGEALTMYKALLIMYQQKWTICTQMHKLATYRKCPSHSEQPVSRWRVPGQYFSRRDDMYHFPLFPKPVTTIRMR